MTPPGAAHSASPRGQSGVLINEVAGADSSSDSHSFFELRNWGTAAVDLTGWQVFRCNEMALRSNVSRVEGSLDGIVLEVGEILTVSKIGMPGAQHMSAPFDLGGYGLYLENAQDELVDRVGVYPNKPWPTQGDCTPPGGNLPNVLDFAHNESWQRVAATGDPRVDFVVAPSTIDAPNATAPEAPVDTGVVISELSGGGRLSGDDDFVELRNDGQGTVDIGGWTVDRCTASGRLRANSRQVTIADGTQLKAGESWVAGGPGFRGKADAHYRTGLDDREFGALVRTASGALVDRVAVSAYGDSACQGDAGKLDAVLDPVADESWQLTAGGDAANADEDATDAAKWIIAPRTPGERNATTESSVFRQSFSYPAAAGVAISEIATDPPSSAMPTGQSPRNWIEVGNYGDTAVDIGGWTLRRCTAAGTRARSVQVTVPKGTKLAAGEVFLAARAGTEAAADAEASYSTALDFHGTGVWLADASGRRVDSVGIYARNELDVDNIAASPCSKGFALATYQVDRMRGESYQRSRFTGDDSDDFVARPATPGTLDLVPWVDPTARVAGVQGPSTAPVASVKAAPTAPADAVPATVLEAWGGSSEGALTTLEGADERKLDPVAPAPISETGFAHPYQRLVVDAAALHAGSIVTWSGSTLARHELQLSVWGGDAWRLADAGASTGSTGEVTLQGALQAGEARDGKVVLLVQDGPRTEATLASAPDGKLDDPGSYDLAITHITDTQYLSESYPEVYAQLVSWIADNAPDRKIEFATHTGDLVQNWVDADQAPARAEREYARASAIQGILDSAGVANSVLPGNHDNKRGVDNSLFNTVFSPQRYADAPWYGGSIAPDDNSANFSTFEAAGAKFLMLSLPYAYDQADMTWAEKVVTAHPDYNVVLSTHEHVSPKTLEVGATRSSNSRWVSRGQQLWDQVIAPNRNVVMVLSGHFHGLGQITTENAGGIEGHTVVELLADYQEFRTHTGERATGFQRLLQVDLASGTIAADTFSVRLDATASYPYDYKQFLADSGDEGSMSNERPWNIVDAGVEGRYTAADDEFHAKVEFQYAKSVQTGSLTVG